MRFLQRAKKALQTPKNTINVLMLMFLRITRYCWPDKIFLKVQYRLRMGKKLNLRNPKTFSEKLQWLKLYDHKPEYTKMVDKYAVKQYVADKIGENYIIPTLGVWRTFDEIDFDRLPDQFVLKTTHDSGGVVIVKDKLLLNKEVAKKKLTKSLHNNYYMNNREWPYKNVLPRIIAEEYMVDNASSGDLYDYKFFCFNGKVKFFKIDFDRFVNHHANYYSPEGQLLPFGEARIPPRPEKDLKMPSQLSSMLELAEKLSCGFVFLRVDFYQVNQSIYFGELTFFPDSGMGRWTDDKWDYKFGEWMILPNK